MLRAAAAAGEHRIAARGPIARDHVIGIDADAEHVRERVAIGVCVSNPAEYRLLY